MEVRGIQSLLAIIIAISSAFMATPVEACGCGIYLPLEGEASVNEEHVLIRWDGKTEDVVMSLGVLGSSKEAAVIFPVPTRATVKLADANIFEALQELTKPRLQYDFRFIPVFGGAGAPPSVTLLERQTLGPFDVSTLAATDASALSDWLAANGYNLPPKIASVLEPYVEQNWYYIAVRLSPGAGAEELTGALDPLWITFDYDQIVYPMRPSALARDTLTVFMYVLADHRVQTSQWFGGYQGVQFAGWIDPTSLEDDSPLLPFVSKKLFLTKIVEQIYQPEDINNDYYFEFAPADDLYRDIKYVDKIAGFPLCFVVPCGVPLLISGSVLFISKRFKKNRHAKSTV